MHAALVESFASAPRYAEVAAPEPADGEVAVDMLAAALYPRVRSQADGSHYTDRLPLPFVAGLDGVGRDAEGRLRYVIAEQGTMAERAAVDARHAVVLPDDADPIAVAAGMNPAMSSWVALRRRIVFQPGQRVLVVGATGAAGRMAVQIARHFGASEVIAAGRDAAKLAALPALGATATVVWDSPDLGSLAGGVDVVLDYLWGEPAARAMAAVVTARPDRGAPLQWVQIGSVAGATAPIPSAALRAAALSIVGSGQGSVPTRDIAAELPAIAAELSAGTFSIPSRTVPLADVTATWTAPAGDERIVFVP